jgi:predicted transcriptional regulator
MVMQGGFVVLPLLAVLALAFAVTAAPVDPLATVKEGATFVEHTAANPGNGLKDPAGTVNGLLNPEQTADPEPAPPVKGHEPGFADRIRAAFHDQLMAAGLAAVIASALGLGGFAFVTRYVSPKEALQNPQRAMLYGFVRGNPGVHLKKLSEEFAMKTSSILWHIRKLENAELVRSERANGFRVFYPVEGGTEIRKVSRAVTALQNANARQLYEAVESKAGVSPAQLASKLAIHGGTVRWHLRKLREFGLVEEIEGQQSSAFFATPLGRRALQTMVGGGILVAQPRPASGSFGVEA